MAFTTMNSTKADGIEEVDQGVDEHAVSMIVAAPPPPWRP
jgi:hypothetical protein